MFMHRHTLLYFTLHYSTVAYIFFRGGVTTEGESGCGTLPRAEAPEEDRTRRDRSTCDRAWASGVWISFDLRGAWQIARSGVLIRKSTELSLYIMTHPEQNSCVSAKSQCAHSQHIVAKYIYLYYFYLWIWTQNQWALRLLLLQLISWQVI